MDKELMCGKELTKEEEMQTTEKEAKAKNGNLFGLAQMFKWYNTTLLLKHTFDQFEDIPNGCSQILR